MTVSIEAEELSHSPGCETCGVLSDNQSTIRDVASCVLLLGVESTRQG